MKAVSSRVKLQRRSRSRPDNPQQQKLLLRDFETRSHTDEAVDSRTSQICSLDVLLPFRYTCWHCVKNSRHVGFFFLKKK